MSCRQRTMPSRTSSLALEVDVLPLYPTATELPKKLFPFRLAFTHDVKSSERRNWFLSVIQPFSGSVSCPVSSSW